MVHDEFDQVFSFLVYICIEGRKHGRNSAKQIGIDLMNGRCICIVSYLMRSI